FTQLASEFSEVFGRLAFRALRSLNDVLRFLSDLFFNIWFFVCRILVLSFIRCWFWHVQHDLAHANLLYHSLGIEVLFKLVVRYLYGFAGFALIDENIVSAALL